MLKRFKKNLREFILRYGEAGFSLVEVIVALAIFGILSAGVFQVVTNSYTNFYGSGDKQTVAQFTQEAIEAVRSIRDNSWQDIENASGAGDKGLEKATNGYWQFSGTANTLGVLTRVVGVTKVYRDSSGNIVDTGGTEDPSTFQVTATTSASGMADYVLTTYLTNWAYKSWVQTDWSGIGSRDFWSDATMASASYSNVNTSTIGELVLSQTVTYNSPGYLYSSIFDLGSTDKELRSVAVEQNVPSGCDLDITVEVSDETAFSSVVSQNFSDNSVTYYINSILATLNGKRYIRYKATLTACNTNADTPTLYSVKLNYR